MNVTNGQPNSGRPAPEAPAARANSPVPSNAAAVAPIDDSGRIGSGSETLAARPIRPTGATQHAPASRGKELRTLQEALSPTANAHHTVETSFGAIPGVQRKEPPQA